MDSGDDGSAVWKHLTSVSYTLRFVKMVTFMPCVLYHNKKGKEKKIFAFISFRFEQCHMKLSHNQVKHLYE